MEIRNWKTNEVIYQAEVDTIKELVEKAVKEGVRFCYADFGYTHLKGADLKGADLKGANLRGAYLRDANLKDADLRDSDLSDAFLIGANFECARLNGTNLLCADLSGADLRDADLSGAYLEDAHLLCADLSGADLSNANLYGADLNGSDLRGANLGHADLRGAENVPENLPMACPKEGSFVAWKKVEGKLIKLEIPADAKRSSATSKKCRCSKAKVLEITDLDGKNPIHGVINSNYGTTIYYVGEMVYPDSFDDDRWNECSNGIHFFMDKQDAIDYVI